MLKTTSRSFIPSPLAQVIIFLNRDWPVIKAREKILIAMPENSFYVPS